MKKLPIGLQNLREMRTQGYAYVDKTAHVARLADQGKYYFWPDLDASAKAC